MIRNLKISLALIVLGFICLNVQAQTSVKEVDGKWELLVDGKPFDVKGVTIGFDVNRETIGKYLADLKFLGVNSVRLWGTNNDTQILLDSAQAYGINVMMGIWLRHGRPGMEGDDNFNYLADDAGMDAMYNDAVKVVEKWKDHPAVLTWGVGNEVYLNIATDKEKKAYSIFLEKVCKKIKELDPNHPVTSVEAWTFGLSWWEKYVPSIDIYGINCYGPGANALPGELEKAGVKKPYIVTEFGVSGEWDAVEDKNGIKIEPNDQQKYAAIYPGLHDWIATKDACLGAYIFHYGDGNNHGSPWLLFFHDGKYRPQYWATREAYTGQKPIDNVPVIEELSLSSAESVSATGTWVDVNLKISDVEDDVDALQIEFYYNQRTGSRRRKDQLLPLEMKGSLKEGFKIKVPDEEGPLKIYANATDSYNNIAIAHTSITADNGGKPHLVAKGTLPFYVYEDGIEPPYIASAYMGNTKYMALNDKYEKVKHSGMNAIRIAYGDSDNWYAVGFVDPPDDWGDKIGGYNLTGAKQYSFWAKSDTPGLEATIGFGLIDDDKAYPDTEKKSLKVNLTTEWKQYFIDVSTSDLSCIRSGLMIYGGGSGAPHTIWIDDVKFE